jgi:hypothetical protein
MTAQASEIVRLEGQDFSLAGVDGRGLFDPRDHGIVTHAVSSACWRGFVNTYEVSEDRLWLVHLTIGFHGREAPVVFGVKPEHEKGDLPHYGYAGLKRPVDFTGGFLLGRDFVREMYVHMGFHPGYAYRIVKEILFDEGRVLEQIDRSDEMAEIREAMLAKTGPLTGGMGPVAAWVQQRFSLRYTARRGNGEPFRQSHPTPESDSSGGAFGELNRRILEGLGEGKTKSEPEAS